MQGLLFLIAIMAAVLAVIFFAQARANGAAVVALRGEADAAGKQAEAARSQVRELQADAKAKTAQLVELREKLADARKKGQENKAGKQQQSRGAREAELLEDLAHARKLTEEAHAAEAQSRKDAAGAKADAAAARVQLAAAQDKVRELGERLAVASTPTPAPVAPAAAAPRPRSDDARLAELTAKAADAEQRAAAAEHGLREGRKREQSLREDAKKAKGRAETNNRVFLVTKGELDLVKERLAQAERRLWQSGIALPVPQAKERPKATGPAAVDRAATESSPASLQPPPPPESAAVAGEGQGAPTLPAEALPAEAHGAADPDSAGEEKSPRTSAAEPEASGEPSPHMMAGAAEPDAQGEGSLQAVLPLRRRPPHPDGADADASKRE